MKTPKLLLPIIALLVLISCSEDVSVVPAEPVVIEEDQFFITLTDNNQTLSIKASSYADLQQYKFAEQIAFKNEEEIGRYHSAWVDGAIIYGIENISVQSALYRTSLYAPYEKQVANFEIAIESSNEKEVMYNQEDITRELFQMQNNVYHPTNLGKEADRLKENFDLAQINISYSLNDDTYKSFYYYLDKGVADLYKQPEESFFNVISVTEKQHRARIVPEDEGSYFDIFNYDSIIEGNGGVSVFDIFKSVFDTFNYDYIIEGNGRVRVFNRFDPENDYKDLEFTFKIPSKKLVPFKI